MYVFYLYFAEIDYSIKFVILFYHMCCNLITTNSLFLFYLYNFGQVQCYYRVEQRKRMFFKWLVLGKGGVDDVGCEPAHTSHNAVSVAMAHWNVQPDGKHTMLYIPMCHDY